MTLLNFCNEIFIPKRSAGIELKSFLMLKNSKTRGSSKYLIRMMH